MGYLASVDGHLRYQPGPTRARSASRGADLVEILHTVRLSIRSHTLVTEPFLVVGLIASIRRILVVTLEATTLTKEGKWSPEGANIFQCFHD